VRRASLGEFDIAAWQGTGMSWQPGWYDDPWSPGSTRWWDGTAWTQHTGGTAAGATAKKRRIWPWLVGGGLALLLLAVVAVALVLVIGGSSDDEVSKAPPRPTTTSSTPSYEEPASKRLPEADLGEEVTLRTQDGPRAKVAVLSVMDPVPRGSYFRGPKRGTRWVGVRVRFKGGGPGTYSDSAANGVRVVTGDGRRYETDFSELDACPAVGDVSLAPGASKTGCVVIPIPKSKNPERVRFIPSSGYAPDVGTWRVR
jgi:hypothetical protein